MHYDKAAASMKTPKVIASSRVKLENSWDISQAILRAKGRWLQSAEPKLNKNSSKKSIRLLQKLKRLKTQRK